MSYPLPELRICMYRYLCVCVCVVCLSQARPYLLGGLQHSEEQVKLVTLKTLGHLFSYPDGVKMLVLFASRCCLASPHFFSLLLMCSRTDVAAAFFFLL